MRDSVKSPNGVGAAVPFVLADGDAVLVLFVPTDGAAVLVLFVPTDGAAVLVLFVPTDGAAVLFVAADGADDAPGGPGVGLYVGILVPSIDGLLDGDSPPNIVGGYVGIIGKGCPPDG